MLSSAFHGTGVQALFIIHREHRLTLYAHVACLSFFLSLEAVYKSEGGLCRQRSQRRRIEPMSENDAKVEGGMWSEYGGGDRGMIGPAAASGATRRPQCIVGYSVTGISDERYEASSLSCFPARFIFRSLSCFSAFSSLRSRSTSVARKIARMFVYVCKRRLSASQRRGFERCRISTETNHLRA